MYFDTKQKSKLEPVNGDKQQTLALSNQQAFSTVLEKSIPYATARLLYGLNTMAMGWAMGRLGSDQVAAGSLFTALQYLLVGIPQGAMLSTGVLVGEKNGAQQYSEVGKVSRASWRLGAFCSIGSVAALLIAPTIIGASGLAPEIVAKDVQQYMNYFFPAVPAILISIAEQQVGLAIKDAIVPLGFTAIYSGVASGLGIPMTLGLLGDKVSGIKGFGISTSISAYSGFFALRAYYWLSSKYEKYDLFRRSYKTGSEDYFQKLKSLGGKFAAQSGAEFVNLIGTSLLLSAYGERTGVPALQMAVPAMQIASAWGLVGIGLGQAQGNLIANERGAMKKAFEENNAEGLRVGSRNITTLARQGVYLGGGITAALALTCLLKPSFFTEIFLSDDLTQEQADESAALVQISSMGLLLDMLRNIIGGNLKGFRDINFATIASFLTMTALFFVTGGVTLFEADSLAGMMWLRNASICIAAGVSLARWKHFERMPPECQISDLLIPVIKETTPFLADKEREAIVDVPAPGRGN